VPCLIARWIVTPIAVTLVGLAIAVTAAASACNGWAVSAPAAARASLRIFIRQPEPGRQAAAAQAAQARGEPPEQAQAEGAAASTLCCDKRLRLCGDLAGARLELVRRDVAETFARVPCASPSVH